MTVKYRITTNNGNINWEYHSRLSDARRRAHPLLASKVRGKQCHTVYIDRLVYKTGKKLPVEEKFVVKYFDYNPKDGSAHFSRHLGPGGK